LGSRCRIPSPTVWLSVSLAIPSSKFAPGTSAKSAGWLTYVLAAVLLLYFVFVRGRMG
jgi:hypothetical protein